MPQDSSGIITSTDGSGISDVNAPAPTEPVVTFSTPIPTPTPELKPTFSTPPLDNMNAEDNYSVVYIDTTTFNYNIIPFDYSLDYPPIVFYYSATVPTVIDKKVGTSSFTNKDDFSVNYETPNSLANYQVTVYKKETDEVVYTYEIPMFSKKSESGKFKFFEAGDYHIEITGNLATVETIIKVPPENLEPKAD
ncbi:MAG: hypothetical protein PHV39_10035 [Methanomicrobium sp.]|nr:hypothetical protein [Methanomicrobium sp.]